QGQNQPRRDDFGLKIGKLSHRTSIKDGLGRHIGSCGPLNRNFLKSQIPVDKGKVYRFGGDEFAVIYTGGTLEELLSILKEIVHFQVGSINLSTSIGVAHSNECPTVERLKMLADERLYKSKKNGRAQISWQ
ncbi:diguanylate cyclase, partial [Escherichia coli]|nr:diguanylate cyclase [Escherichia coli]MCS0832416.1 diguanylate cyclase [Escherichia coli]